jgi:hypothetical protein
MIRTGPVKWVAHRWRLEQLRRSESTPATRRPASPSSPELAILAAEDLREPKHEAGERFSTVQLPGGVDHGG